MSNITTDKWGVQQLVTDYSSWGASDDVNAIPKPGIGVKPIDIIKPSNWTTPVVGAKSGARLEEEVDPITVRSQGIKNLYSEMPVMTDGTLDRLAISYYGAVSGNPFAHMFDTTKFKPNPTFDSAAEIVNLRDKQGVYLDDKMVESLRETSSKEEFDYVLDTRRELAINEQAQSLNMVGSLAGHLGTGVALGGMSGLLAKSIGLTGKALASTAVGIEILSESTAALMADANNQYNADWPDAIGIGLVGAGVGARALKGSTSALKGSTSASKVTDAVDDVVDGIYATVDPTTKSKYRYHQDNANVGGTMYKQYKNGNIKMNGVDIPFEDAPVSGGKVDVEAKPSWQRTDIESIEGYRVLGTTGLSPELKAELDKIYPSTTGAVGTITETINDIDVKLDTTTVTVEAKDALLTQRKDLASNLSIQGLPQLDDTVEIKSADSIIDESIKESESVSKTTKPTPTTQTTSNKPKPSKSTSNDSKSIPEGEPVKLDAKAKAKSEAKLKEYSSTVDKLEKQIASKEKAKSKSYSQSAIDKLNAEIKEIRPELAKARKNKKRAEERLGIVREVVKVVKDIKEYEKAVGKAKGVIESLSKKDITQEDVKKALAKAESILRDKEKALAKVLDNKS